ncbi:MAG: response regulator [bacterium]|nr:response regulator [bacterium]
MSEEGKLKSKISDLEARIQYLEGINRLSLDALDKAANLGDFQTSINKLHSSSLILNETRARVRTLIHFEADAFYRVDESNSEFYLDECSPVEYRSLFLDEVDELIESGTFAWAIREQRSIFVSTRDQKKKILLHVIATSSRVRGMFVGILTHGEMDAPLVSLSLMSIILRYSANALESFELYSMIKTINTNLEKTVEDRTKELQYQLNFENLVARFLTSFIDIPAGETVSTIHETLGSIAKFTSAKQHFILFFEDNSDLVKCITELELQLPVKNSYFSLKFDKNIIDRNEFPYILKRITELESFFIPNASRLPSYASNEKSFFKSMNIKSVVIVPMVSGNSLAGFFGFGFSGMKGNWSVDIGGLLKIVGEIFIIALNRVKMKMALQNSQEQLRHAQKMEALGRLAGGVAHDFNNILTAITISSEVSLLSPEINDSTAHKLKDILKAAERAADLTRQLLVVSRKQIIKPIILDAGIIAIELNKMLSRLIPEDIVISLKLEKHLPPIKADSGQFEQILLNLVVNARDAIVDNPQPFADKNIVISISKVMLENSDISRNIIPKAGKYLRIRVSDTGMGMDADTSSKIFEPFFTTKKEGKGTGLGLATVYGIVKQNDAEIMVDTGPGAGAVFSIYWPCALQASSETDAAPSDYVELMGDETVMLVEDDNDVRTSVQELLVSMGYTVIEAVNGEAALEKFCVFTGSIDILITDVMMPVMNGRKLADNFRKLVPDIRIIFTSGYSDDPLSITESLPPNTCFIQKPYSVNHFIKMVRQLLDEKKQLKIKESKKVKVKS